MKELYIFLLLLTPLYSCSSDSDEPVQQNIDYFGTWHLVKMTGSFHNSETTGDNMEWQETYIFKANGTFIKKRKHENNTVTASGSYVFNESPQLTTLKLLYTTPSQIVGSCYSDVEERLYFDTASVLVSTWRACDGPGLEYKKFH